jgi:hypothetical protein
MVKHGQNKKRRAGRIGKTKLKNRTYHRWDPKPKFSNDAIKKNWDVSKSPAQNLASLGLVSKPNNDVHRPNEQLLPSITSNVVELFDIPDSDEMNKTKREFPLPEEEQKYIAKCMTKHGKNYGKIFRDIKLNYMQHTETQLKKMGARFLLLSPDQRIVDIPEKATM